MPQRPAIVPPDIDTLLLPEWVGLLIRVGPLAFPADCVPAAAMAGRGALNLPSSSSQRCGVITLAVAVSNLGSADRAWPTDQLGDRGRGCGSLPPKRHVAGHLRLKC